MLHVTWKKLFVFFLLLVLCEIVTGVVQGSSVWFKQQLFDQAKAAAEGEAFYKIGAAAAALCIVLILQLLLNADNAAFESSFVLRLEQAAGEELNRKAARVDPICYVGYACAIPSNLMFPEAHRFPSPIRRPDPEWCFLNFLWWRIRRCC